MPETRPTTETAQVLKALHFAAQKHCDQRRKGSDASPYINHPIAVAELLSDVGGVTDPVVLIAALLHDTIEDTGTRGEELEEHFGAAVRALVEEVTDDKSLPKAERKQQQIEHTLHLSHNAKLIKLGDKISNVLDVTHNPGVDWSADRRLEYLDWAERVIAGCRGTNAALERRFDEVIASGKAAIRLVQDGSVAPSIISQEPQTRV
jgi:guanosine-3',5'-bis(diphosphate) 3'-pyrophosphohydrolase